MKKQVFVFMGLTGGFLLFPEAVSADNCSAFTDCFNNAKAAAAAAAGLGILAALASAAADLTPGVGEGKAAVQLFTGYDPITKERVPRWESAVGLIPVFGRVAARGMRMGRVAARARGAMQTARGLRGGAKGLSKGIDVYEKIREPYDRVTTVRDAAADIAGKIRDRMEQSQSKQSIYPGTTAQGMDTQQASSSEPRVHEAHAVFIPPDQLFKILSGGFKSIPSDAPATIAHDTLKDLAKTFGKNSDTLKSIAKAKAIIGYLPKDATMKDVVDKLKG